MGEQNKAIVHRYFLELFGRGDLAVVDGIFASECIIYPPAYMGEPIHGRAGVKEFVTKIRGGFPDFRFDLGEELAEGDKVGSVFTLHGTHRGEYMGLPPTGREIHLEGMDLFRIVNGQITEVHIYYDTLGLMQQLGVVPAPSAVGA